MQCKRARLSHLCGAPELFARSYPVHVPWPHGTTDFVLERRPARAVEQRLVQQEEDGVAPAVRRLARERVPHHTRYSPT